MGRSEGALVRAQRERAREAAEVRRARLAHVQAAQEARQQAVQVRDAPGQEADERRRKQRYVMSRQAEAAAMNAELEAQVRDLKGLLDATLVGGDLVDVVDLDRLRRSVAHPRFEDPVHGTPAPEPVWERFAPSPPRGLRRLFGGGARYRRAVTEARQRFEQARREYDEAEEARRAAHERARQEYLSECGAREEDVSEHNAGIDRLVAALTAGDPAAVVEYFDLVLASSVYPEGFPQHYRLAYLPEPRQLVVEYGLPLVDAVPAVRAYRYVKIRDEIATSARPARAIRTLYRSVVAQLALRTLRELFAADRSGWLDAVVFNGVAATTDPATGLPFRPCLVSVRVTRTVFAELDLDKVEPAACLAYLRAAVSAKPDALVPVEPVLDFGTAVTPYLAETAVAADLDGPATPTPQTTHAAQTAQTSRAAQAAQAAQTEPPAELDSPA